MAKRSSSKAARPARKAPDAAVRKDNAPDEAEDEELEHAAGPEADELAEDDEQASPTVDLGDEDDEVSGHGEPEADERRGLATELALVPAGRSLALRDPLQAYINEAKRYPLLSREEEHELAVRYAETGDVDAARRLVTSNLRLVVKIAHQYRRAYRNLLDLVQEGNIGLMHAVKKFDPYRGVKLSSYAAWWIRAYILKFILANWRMVKIGTTQSQRKLFYNLRKEVDKLRAMGIDNPAPRLLAERLDVPEHEVETMQQRLAGGDVSLDAPISGQVDGSSSRLDFVTDDRSTPDRSVANRQFSELLNEAIAEFAKTLSGRDQQIFELRTVADEPLTLQQIGDRYGITRERARQIEQRIMGRLREHLRDKLGDAVDIHLGGD